MKPPKRKRVTPAQLSIRTGDIVVVTRDNGAEEVHQALSDPWQLGHGDWVIKLNEICGGYALERCKKIVPKPCEAVSV